MKRIPNRVSFRVRSGSPTPTANINRLTADLDDLKQRKFRVSVEPQASGMEVGINVSFSIMVRRNLVSLAAFFVEAYPPALALLEVVFDLHTDDRTDTRERVNHRANERPVSEAADCGTDMESRSVRASSAVRPL